MPIFTRALDLNQGFYFKKDKQNPIGQMLSLKIGETALAPDFSVVNPDDQKANSVVGVLSHFT